MVHYLNLIVEYGLFLTYQMILIIDLKCKYIAYQMEHLINLLNPNETDCWYINMNIKDIRIGSLIEYSFTEPPTTFIVLKIDIENNTMTLYKIEEQAILPYENRPTKYDRVLVY